MRPSRCCSSVNHTLKSALKSPASAGGPRERPPHSPLVRPQLRERRTRHRPEHHVVVDQVHGDPVEAVRARRAGRAAGGVIGPELKWWTRSCERSRNRSASEALPSSVSNRDAVSIRSHGSSCRRRASSSLRRVSSFSASSNASRQPLFTCPRSRAASSRSSPHFACRYEILVAAREITLASGIER
jgi:hypothetical protein